MIALRRLKAIEASIDPQGGGWSHAAQHELTARPGQGLVSQKDRTLANRDVRDEQRSRAPRGLPALWARVAARARIAASGAAGSGGSNSRS